mmetsp:Transcript_90492/g.207108  ORF Transcript_90492/g.207108 Transcript_90492/m.207108 type:complete len:114 (+) Transcript_90492:109-450(+)
MSSLRGGRTAPRPAVPGQKSLLAVDLAEPVAKLERAAEFADWDAGNVRSEVREELQASLRLLDRVDHVTEADRHVQKAQTEDFASDVLVGQKKADHLFLAEVLHRGEQQKKAI